MTRRVTTTTTTIRRPLRRANCCLACCSLCAPCCAVCLHEGLFTPSTLLAAALFALLCAAQHLEARAANPMGSSLVECVSGRGCTVPRLEAAASGGALSWAAWLLCVAFGLAVTSGHKCVACCPRPVRAFASAGCSPPPPIPTPPQAAS